jgi:hypothetical protein
MLNALVTLLGHFRVGIGKRSPGISMDSYREQPSDYDLPGSEASEPPQDVAAAIGTDERRMHVRAYNHWVSLLNGRDFPSIEELEPGDVEDFSAHSVLLDFTCGRDNPAIPYVGGAIREECALDETMGTIDDVPSRSLLSRLTDHYMQIIANRSPVGFEAEFENPMGDTICYRGILMPFSSDGEAIDFIYGVINWKHVDGAAASPEAAGESATIEIAGIEENQVEAFAEEEALELTEMVVPEAVEAPAEPTVAPEPQPDTAPVHFSWEDGPNSDEEDAGVVLDEDAGLADRLWAARETAESVKAGEGRTRAALYRALSLAYDFAVAAQQNPDEYSELLEESGVKAQARAPMTPIVKLVFGIDYDKARLTEFAAALSYARRQEIGLGGFQQFIEKHAGGLKGLVAAERQARRPEPKADTKSEFARNRLRAAPTISLAGLTEEFALVVTRRGPDGTHQPVAIVHDEALIERAIRRAG